LPESGQRAPAIPARLRARAVSVGDAGDCWAIHSIRQSIYILDRCDMNNFLNIIVKKASWKTSILFTGLFMTFYSLINFSGIGVAGLLK